MAKIHTFEWMELKIIIWIIIGIVYLISRSRKKQEPPIQPSSDHEEVSNPTKPISFEELLREIQSAKTAKPTPKPVAQYTDYDEDIEEEEKDLEKTDYSFRDQDKTYEAYERAKQEAFHRPSMEETLKLENTIVRFGQFKGYQQEEKSALAAEFAEDLKNPVNFRKAFILSEILNRKF